MDSWLEYELLMQNEYAWDAWLTHRSLQNEAER
jgi:hypothetical protein